VSCPVKDCTWTDGGFVYAGDTTRHLESAHSLRTLALALVGQQARLQATEALLGEARLKEILHFQHLVQCSGLEMPDLTKPPFTVPDVPLDPTA
jgi:hypothetical protein